MQCITVFPILKKTFSDTLMYWTNETCAVGDIIEVNIQKRKVWAVVDGIISVYEAKEYIKSQTFTIRKIDKIVKTDFFSQEFILAVLDTSRYYVRPFGDIFSELVPKRILENISMNTSHVAKSNVKIETEYIQLPLEDRIEKLKEINTDSTYIYSPIKTHASYLKEKKLKNVYLPIDLYKLDQVENPTCILELASSEYYRHLHKDFDIRFFIRNFCRRKHIPLIESDTLLPLYIDKHTRKTKTIDFDIPKTPTIHLVDMTKSGKAKTKDKNKINKRLNLISPELASLIKHCQKKNESLLLYTVRKGFSSQTICGDCHNVLQCGTCTRPLRLAEQEGTKIYICDICHITQTTNIACPICSSWNLTPLGTSTEAIREELEYITDMKIVLIDSNNQTKSSAKKVLKNKNSQKKGVIYIGTELLLTQSYEQTFDYSALVSLESLLALPSRTAEFESARVIYTLIDRTKTDLLIQTRNSKHPIWKSVQEKTWKPLIDQIEHDTKALFLPPYSVHIQICSRTNLDTIYTHLKQFVDVKKTKQPDKTILHIFFTHETWPDNRVYPYLKILPPSVDVQVDRTNFI